jgi:hypothetical protein
VAPRASQSNDDVAAFLRTLDHPLAKEIALVRKAILGASPRIGEAIKWNAPSSHREGPLATFHLRSTVEVRWFFIASAKVRADKKPLEVPDPRPPQMARQRPRHDESQAASAVSANRPLQRNRARLIELVDARRAAT